MAMMKVPAGLVSGEGCLLGSPMAIFCYVFTWLWGQEGKEMDPLWDPPLGPLL